MGEQKYSNQPCFYDFMDGYWESINCCSRTYPSECCFKEKGATWETCEGGKAVADWLMRVITKANETGEWEVF